MNKAIKYRLSGSTVAEPLVNSWYAWSYLISPVPASLHLMQHQMPTLRSYLEDPESHVRLARDPEFAGGPFCEIAPSRAAEVRELLARTERRQSANLQFARAITEYHNWLSVEARGQSLEPFYKQLPDELRGYVELVYDYYHHPTVRFHEGLLYASKYYDRSLQSFRIFSNRRDNARPFFMSTPRFQDAGQVGWEIPFDDARVSEFYKLDLEPQPLGYIGDLLSLSAGDRHTLLSLLSLEPVRLPEPWRERRVRIKYFGHACVLIEWNGVAILTDPYIPVIPSEGGIERFSYHDLPERIDFALVTHNHQDHFALETLLRLRNRIDCLVVPKAAGILYGDLSLKLMAQQMKFKRVQELDTLESIPLPDGEIIGIPFLGEHGDLAYSKSGYIIRAGKEQILFGADSDCLDKQMYLNIRAALGRIETVFIGTECVGAPLTWHNGSLFLKKPTREQDQTRRYHGCDSEAALNILEAVGANRVYNYAMGKEPWLEHLLGLGLSGESPQLRASRRLLQRSRGRGFLVASSPYGKCEIYLDGNGGGSHAGFSKDFSPAQEGLRSESPVDVNLAFWRDQLAGLPNDLELPGDGASAQTAEARPAQMAFSITADLARALEALSAAHEADLFVILLASFQTMLYQISGQDDLVIGTTAASCNFVERAAMTNACDDLLILRTDVSCDPSFNTVIERTKAVIARALAHWPMPDAALVKGLPADDSPQVGLFRVMVTFSNADGPQPPACDLTLLLSEGEQGVTGIIKYNDVVFDAGTIALMIDQYLLLLERVVAHPDLELSAISLMRSTDEAADMLSGHEAVEDTEDQFIF